MGGREPEVEAWFAGLSEHQRGAATELADLARDAIGGPDEAIKWGRLTFTVGDDWHHWICAVGATKTAVKLLFHKGVLLDDPSGLLEGDGRYLRQVPHDVAAANADAVSDLVRDAVERQTDMLDPDG